MKLQSIKIPLPTVHGSKIGFSFGSCAIIAISQFFNIESRYLILIAKALDIKKPEEGLTFVDCSKLINFVAKQNNKTVKYYSNKPKLTYSEMRYTASQGLFIVCFDQHLSYLEDGQVYDSFVESDLEFLNRKPTGWWALKINIY